MKKKILISACLLIVCSGAQADNKKVVMCTDTRGTNIGVNNFRSIPIVTYEDNEVTIKSQDGTTSAYVVIKNSHGEVIYEGEHALSPSGNIINVPDGVGRDKESIEIYYDEECAYGYFQ